MTKIEVVRYAYIVDPGECLSDQSVVFMVHKVDVVSWLYLGEIRETFTVSVDDLLKAINAKELALSSIPAAQNDS